MHTIKDDLDSDESMKKLLVRAKQLVNASQSKVDPRYLSRMEEIHGNDNTIYPYKDGKKELWEYILLWKNTQNATMIRRFIDLWRKLRKYKIIPNDITDHARELAEENAKKRKAIEESGKPDKQDTLINKVGARKRAFTTFHH